MVVVDTVHRDAVMCYETSGNKNTEVKRKKIKIKKQWIKQNRKKNCTGFFLCCLFASFVTCIVLFFFTFFFFNILLFFFVQFFCFFLSFFVCFFIYLFTCVYTPRDCADQWRCVHWWITNSSKQNEYVNKYHNVKQYNKCFKGVPCDVCYIPK